MKYSAVLFFVFLAVLTSYAHADIRMTGPEVTPTATPDPGKADVVDVYEVVNGFLKVTDTKDASYDLLVKAETKAYGKGWVGVRAEGTLDTGLQLNPAVNVEKVSFLLVFPEYEETEAYARGNFITETTGRRTLTGKGVAAVSAGGNALSFAAGGWGVGTGDGRIALDGTVITKTTSFTINRGREVPGGITDGQCARGAYNLCNDSGRCSFGGSITTAGACGHLWCLCRSGSGSGSGSSNGGSNNGGSTTTPTPTTPTPTTPTTPTPTPTVQCANNYIGSGACTKNRVVTSSSTEHRATCSTHGTYWDCNATAKTYHQSRICTRCSLSYQNCTNHSSACQNTRWHTQSSDPYVTGECGHTYRKSASGSHDSILCSDTTCTLILHYACWVHTDNTNTGGSSTGGSSTGGSSTGGYTPTTGACGHTYSTSETANHQNVTGTCGHTYRNCSSAAKGIHQDVTCTRCGTTYQKCSNPANGCQGTLRHTHNTNNGGGSSNGGSSTGASTTPTTPTPTVQCPANSWTSCGGTTSHATTCAAGHTYYTCNSNAVSTHSQHTAGVVCPANSWTSCGGTTSHATTCGRGHTYYTGNSNAVAYHSGH